MKEKIQPRLAFQCLKGLYGSLVAIQEKEIDEELCKKTFHKIIDTLRSIVDELGEPEDEDRVVSSIFTGALIAITTLVDPRFSGTQRFIDMVTRIIEVALRECGIEAKVEEAPQWIYRESDSREIT